VANGTDEWVRVRLFVEFVYHAGIMHRLCVKECLDASKAALSATYIFLIAT